MPIKDLIADDTEIMREAMHKVIEEEPGIKVVGEASSFGQTMQAIADCKPDVPTANAPRSYRFAFSC